MHKKEGHWEIAQKTALYWFKGTNELYVEDKNKRVTQLIKRQ